MKTSTQSTFSEIIEKEKELVNAFNVFTKRIYKEFNLLVLIHIWYIQLFKNKYIKLSV